MQTQIRDDAASLIVDFATVYPSIPLVFDNSPFDWNSPPPQFLEVEVVFYNGEQVGFAYSPKTRIKGYVYFSVYTREGEGARAALGILDWLNAQYAYKHVGITNFEAPCPDGNKDRAGYRMDCLKVPFFSDPT